MKPGTRVAVMGIDDASFMRDLRRRTGDVIAGKPRRLCDIVIIGVDEMRELDVLKEAKKWIEPNGAIWLVRPKGGRSELKDTDLIEAGLAAGLVDNKIASFSETHGAMRFVFRLRDRPR
ncbi:MAG TPA: DUF3052 family protein [Candidatus Dormibacteraeota bacterium]|nr:DUF3052 family protein [Candidatus Dormibacteraeota bacterium]